MLARVATFGWEWASTAVNLRVGPRMVHSCARAIVFGVPPASLNLMGSATVGRQTLVVIRLDGVRNLHTPSCNSDIQNSRFQQTAPTVF